MTTTKLSSKGQVIIPAHIRKAHRWKTGQELLVVDAEDGVFLKPRSPFEPASFENLAGCLSYSGPAKSLEDMEEAIAEGARASVRDDCS